MAMEQVGYVAELCGDFVKVRVDRESACGGNCAGCHGCPHNAILISCDNDLENPFTLGENVRVIMPTGIFFSGMLKSYGVLIFTVLLGAVVGYWLTHMEGFSVLGAFLGLLLGGGWTTFYSRRFRANMKAERIRQIGG